MSNTQHKDYGSKLPSDVSKNMIAGAKFVGISVVSNVFWDMMI